MLVPVLWPQFLSSLAMSLLLFSMVFESSPSVRLIEAVGVFVLSWVSLALYALADKRVSKAKSIF